MLLSHEVHWAVEQFQNVVSQFVVHLGQVVLVVELVVLEDLVELASQLSFQGALSFLRL